MKNVRNLPILLLAFLTVCLLGVGCQKEAISTIAPSTISEPQEMSGFNRLPPAGFFDVVSYNLHPEMTILDYTVKARKNSVWNGFSNWKPTWGIQQIKNIEKYKNSLPGVTRKEFEAFLSQLNNPSHFAISFLYTDGQKYVVYRNWKPSTESKPFLIRPVDIQFETTSPFYYKSGYISCNLNPYKIDINQYGLPYKIISMPTTLKLIHAGAKSITNPGHIGIEPVTKNYTQSAIQTELNKIVVELAH